MKLCIISSVSGANVYSRASRQKRCMAYSRLSPDPPIARMPGGERSRQTGFYQDVTWWEDNRDRVNRAWSRWVMR